MKKLRRLLAGLLCCTMLMGTSSVMAYAADDGIMPYYDQTSMVTINLSFKNNLAYCYISVVGYSDTRTIKGDFLLYDETAQKQAGYWRIDTPHSYYMYTEKCFVQPGHKYTLSFRGKVTGASGTDDIRLSKTATND